ncbi:MAG TPA: ATP synthase F1 subunit epsilon [Patescibacteria group bacterium]
MTKQLHLTIVSQEKKLLDEQVDSITLPASEGEITVLPDHIPLFTKLSTGELIYRQGKEEHSFVITKGFVDIGPDNHVQIMVDAAIAAKEISLEKAQQAIQNAQRTMEQSQDQRELMLAEASLRQAMWEIRVAQKSRKVKI